MTSAAQPAFRSDDAHQHARGVGQDRPAASPRVGFRPDINGLRAIAVVSVILFHAKAPLITGGYAGVDVFFVISGFLMTSIIVGRLQRSTFSFLRFYADRARRILPALMSAIAVLLIAGFFVIEPSSYKALSEHALASLLFVSNVVYQLEAGYFDAPSESKWLLHTWSLSVEWQFYIIYPIALWGIFAWNVMRRRLLPALWVLAGLSFALCIVVSLYRSEAAFFLLPTRAWEMLAGGIVYAHGRPAWLTGSRPRLLQAAGLALIAAAFFAFDRATLWPSWRAFVPVAGTSLVILAQHVEARWATNPVTDLAGRWSYAAYIWHWPIIVGVNLFAPDHLVLATIGLTAGLVAGAGAAAWSWQRLRVRESLDRSRGLAAMFAALALACTLGYATDGLIWRVDDPARVRRYEAAFADSEYPFPCGSFARGGRLSACEIGGSDRPSTLVLGDSHAEMLYPRFAEMARSHPERGKVSFATRGGCPILPDVSRYVSGARCPAFFEQALAMAESGQYRHVVIASFWTGYLVPTARSVALDPLCFRTGGSCRPEPDPEVFAHELDAAFARFATRLGELVRRGTTVTIVLPFPQPAGNLPHDLERRAFLHASNVDLLAVDRERLSRTNDVAVARLRHLAERSGARLIDPTTFLCGADSCPTTDDRGEPLFRDASHFRASVVRSDRFAFLDELARVDH